MKKILAFLLFLVIGIVLLAQLIFETGPSLIFDKVLEFGLWSFAIFVLVSVSNFLLYTWKWYVIIRAHGLHVNIFHLFFYRMMGYTVSYLTPMMQVGGEPLRIYFLHQEKIALKDATSTVIIDKFLELSTTIFFIFIGFMIYLSEGVLADGQMIVAVLSFLAMIAFIGLFTTLTVNGKGFFSTLLSVFGLYKFRPLKTYRERIFEMEQKMHHFFVKRGQSLVLTVFLSFLMYIVIVLEFWMLLYFLGTPVTFGQAFVMSTLPSIAYFIPIPGAIGALEGAQVATFSLMGIDPKLGLVVVMIIRLRDIVFLCLGMGAASFYGLGSLKAQLMKMWKKGE